MGDVNYAPFIEKMQWSYSRVSLFDDCPYAWYLKYVYQAPQEKQQFFSSYGSFIHSLLEQFLTGKADRNALVAKYLTGFDAAVGDAPNHKIYKSYFQSGLSYLRSIAPPDLEILDVERKVNFTVDGIRFVGFIDVLGKTDSGLVIIDHKSRALKPRSGRKKPTKSDEELDEYLRQLYLYSAAVHEECGEFPSQLWFNCFRVPVVIKQEFDTQKYEQNMQIMTEKVRKIAQTKEFPPHWEYFKCNYLCDMCDECEYHEMNSK